MPRRSLHRGLTARSQSIVLALGLLLLSGLLIAPRATAVGDTWTGSWETDFGAMELRQSGDKVTGTYDHDGGRIHATVSGSRLKGKWSEAPTYKPPNDAGDVQLRMSADALSFTGRWRYGSSGAWSTTAWTGVRLAPTDGPTPVETAVAGSPAPQSSRAPVESLTPVESLAPVVSPAPVESPGIAGDPWAIPPIPEAGDIPAYEATEPITGHLTLGPETHLATATISTAGGTFEAGGMRVEVPTAALADDTTFEVTQAQISGSGFGDLVTPITPLYLVEDGGAALGEPVTLTLPATIPSGSVAMAFSYDDASGVITPLIPIAQDATTLTVGATHFSGVFGGLLDLAKMPSTVDSGFRPGVDDWTFPNEGSYAAKGGHCEGQSLSAIWYYINQRRRDSAMPLHEVGDNNDATAKTPDFWSDDSNAYRFVSSVHNGPVAVLKTYLFFRNMWDNTNDRMAYNAFWAAIALTGEPQLIRISSAPNTGGHTMIVYRVTPDRLYIADPNYPGRLRTIRYDALTGKLGPYNSGDNATSIAAAGTTSYIKFGYVPWQTSKTSDTIAGHWAEYQAGVAGDAIFPAYTLEALSGKDAQGADTWVPLVDGYQTTETQLTFRLHDPAGVDDLRMWAYRGTSATPAAPPGNQVTIDLQDGPNPIGILEEGSKPAWTTWEYVDFVRLTVTRGGGLAAAAVQMEIAGSFTRSLSLTDVKVAATGPRTFASLPTETRIKSLTGEIAEGGKAVTLTITYLDDPTVGAVAECPNVTILRDIPFLSADPVTRTQTFFVSGWDAIMATIEDSYPYINNRNVTKCMTTDGWSFNQDANPNPAVYIVLGS